MVHSSIVVRRVCLAGEVSGLFEQESILLDRTWDGSESPVSAEVWIVIDGDNLVFGARVPCTAWCDRGAKAGAYVPDLWKQNVAELFIAGADGRYQEFNLSPTGAWWSMAFVAPRVREPVFSPPCGVETYATMDETSWRAALSVPIRELVVAPEGPGGTRMNLNVIINEDPRVYLSQARLPGDQVDFHQPQAFSRVG